jgi:23S rRNA (guanosine2251-2'-O)-methyltransferase
MYFYGMEKTHQKIANADLDRLSVEDYKKAAKTPIIVVLDNIRSLNNIGSVFRTGDAFLIEAIYLCGYTAKPPHRDIQKTALGATESVHWEYFETTMEAVEKLKSNGYLVASVEQAANSVSLENVSADKPMALVFGNEVRGVDQAICDASDICVEIPQLGTKHSLNISVCAGVVLWELFKKYQLTNK